VKEIRTGDPTAPSGPRLVRRRGRFANTEIFLPLVLYVADDRIRELLYEDDILSAVEWQEVDVSSLVSRIPDNVASAERQMQRISLAESGEDRIVVEEAGGNHETLVFDTAYAVRMVSDIVPNAWWSREIVGRLVSGLESRGFTMAMLGRLSGLIIEELRKWLSQRRDQMAESLFREAVIAGRIQFRLRADGRNWRLPFSAMTFEPEGADQLLGGNGGALGKSLFSPIYKGDFSSQDERDIAVYLDSDKALTWWHRNVARSHFSIQGWRREKVYPDFIFAVRHGEHQNRMVVLEMKGKHLAGNDDTEYKKAVLKLMSNAFSDDSLQHVGELDLVVDGRSKVECDLVLIPDWKTRLPDFLR